MKKQSNDIMDDKKKLTPKQAKFVNEYLIDLNATQAAIRSGYSKKTAKEIGQENLTKPLIKEAVQKRQNKIKEKTEVSQEWVVKSLKSVAERCMVVEPVFDKEGEATGEYTFNASGANRSLELLGKHLGIFTEKVELSGNISLGEQILKAQNRIKD